MKLNIVVLAALTMSPLLLAEESSQWKFLVGGDIGTYDRSDYSYTGWYGGIGYKTEYGTHALVIGGGDIESSQGGVNFYPDVESFSLAYRYSYNVSQKFELFAEFGLERLSWSETLSDALGNPLSLGFDDTNYFVGLGAEVKLIEHVYLTVSVRYYLSENDVFTSSALGSDALGNLVTVEQEAPDLTAKIGLTFKF